MRSILHVGATCLGIILLYTPSFSQTDHQCYIADEAAVPREHSVDMEKLSLEISFDTKNSMVKGKVTHAFKVLQQNVDTLFLDAPGINIEEISFEGKTLKFSTSKDGVTLRFPRKLQWDEKYTVTIRYNAKPQKGIYFIGWNDPLQLSRKQIWTQGQGIDNRHWIPMYDGQNDKVLSDIKITFPEGYNVLSNGTLAEKKVQKDQTVTWHYKMTHPHPTYLIMLAIGDYKVKTLKAASGVPIHLWYYPDHEGKVEYTYRYMKEMFDFFEKEIGYAYPWESYAQVPVQEFMYGAMENTTATIFGDFFCVDQRAYNDRNYVAVNAHELAHQWFGDLVTARTTKHHWLQESFATHYNLTFEKEAFGQDHFDWGRRNAALRALEAGEKDNLPIAHSGAGSPRFYPKGAFVLEMLKYVAGRAEFNRAVKYYLQQHAYQNVDSEDLLIAFHETLGKSYDWFWEEWIYHGGEPEYQVSYDELNDNAGSRYTQFAVKQVHNVNEEVGLFKMPVFFEVHYTDGSSDQVQEWIEEKFETVKVPNPGKKNIAYVLFDPNSQLLKKVTFTKSTEMCLAQLGNAAHMLDRYDAAIALARLPVEEKIQVYTDVYAKETFYAVKGEILTQVVASGSELPEAKALVNKGLNDKDVQVRKVLLKAINLLKPDQLAIVSGYFNDPEASYELLEDALKLLITSDPGNAKTYFDQSASLEGIGMSFRVKWLEWSFGTFPQNNTYIKELVGLTSQSYEFRTRVNAMEALARLGYCDEILVKNILDALPSANRRLSGPAGSVLKELARQNQFRQLIEEVLEMKDANTQGVAAARKLLG